MQDNNGVFNRTRPIKTQEPDPQVNPKAEPMQFNVEYKLSLLAEAERCSKPAQIGALLRREGPNASHLLKWRELREAGGLGQQPGRKPNPLVQQGFQRARTPAVGSCSYSFPRRNSRMIIESE